MIKNHKITKKIVYDGVFLKGYVPSKLFLDIAPEIKKVLWEYQVTNDDKIR